jgi:predicted enzyme related to lactoylglutathione lyase
MPNPIVHFEIIGKNGPALRNFYSDMFGWQIQVPPEMDYGLVENGGEGINGGIGGGEDTSVIFYIQVDDPQAYLDKIGAAGGKTVVPLTTIPGMVTFAHFADPQGNVVGLVSSEMPPA